MPEEINLQNIDDDGRQSHHYDLGKLPLSIRVSNILTSDNLKQLAQVTDVPFIDPAFHDDRLKDIIQYYFINPAEMETEIHCYAKQLLDNGRLQQAWQVLLSIE